PPITPIPSIHLLCMYKKYITAFECARETYSLPPSIKITYHESSLAALEPGVSFDAIVSPANSFARMDGAFDDALSRVFSPQADYLGLTSVTQAAVYKEYRGFLPPGASLLVDMEGEEGKRVGLRKNDWGCRYLALCPSMKVPENVNWDREVVFESVWTLLAAIERHNRRMGEEGGEVEGKVIESVLMTPLATGVGLVSPEKWAAQTVLAIRQFVEA
ncbi:macro domain-like protein, partial [Massarina eburnea CBS 473.64]